MNSAERIISSPVSSLRAREERLQRLLTAWLQHVDKEHHGEEIFHDKNFGCTYIKCCAKKCRWEMVVPRT